MTTSEYTGVLNVWDFNQGEKIGYSYGFRSDSITGFSPQSFKDIKAIRDRLDLRLKATIVKHRDSNTNELRQALDDEMVDLGAALANAFFDSNDVVAVTNFARAGSYTSVIETGCVSNARLPYEMMCFPHEMAGGASAPSYFGDLTIIQRSVKPCPTKNGSDQFAFVELAAEKVMIAVGPGVPGSEKYVDSGFDHMNDLFNRIDCNHVFFIVAKCDHDDVNPGVILARNGGAYTLQTATVRRFPPNSLIVLMSCQSHSNGIAAAISEHSRATVLGASTDLITADTLRMIEALLCILNANESISLLDLLRRWNDWDDGKDRVFRRLLALRGSINLILRRDRS